MRWKNAEDDDEWDREDWDASEDEDDIDEDEDGEEEDTCIPCPKCGFLVYEDSPWCPSCGDYVTFPTGAAGAWSGRPSWWILLGILGVLAMLLTMLAV